MLPANMLSHALICQANLLALHTDKLLFLGSDRWSFTNFANRPGKIETNTFIRVGEINGMGIANLRDHREQ
jgi:hypothetical protein